MQLSNRDLESKRRTINIRSEARRRKRYSEGPHINKCGKEKDFYPRARNLDYPMPRRNRKTIDKQYGGGLCVPGEKTL